MRVRQLLSKPESTVDPMPENQFSLIPIAVVDITRKAMFEVVLRAACFA
jgi:hypothetical protein